MYKQKRFEIFIYNKVKNIINQKIIFSISLTKFRPYLILGVFQLAQ